MRPDSSIQWAAYPALLLAACLAVGIVLESHAGGVLASGKTWWSWGLVIAAGLALWAVAAWTERRRLVTLAPLTRLGGLLLLAIAAGGLRMVVHDTQPRDRLHLQAAAAHPDADVRTADFQATEKVEGRKFGEGRTVDGRRRGPRTSGTGTSAVRRFDVEATIVGRIAGPPDRPDDATRFTLGVESWLHPGGSASASGRVRVTCQVPPWSDEERRFSELREGDRIRICGRLRSLPERRNPADFDYGAYLQRRSVHSTLWTSDPACVDVIRRADDLLPRSVARVREHTRTMIADHLPSPAGRSVLQALLLGDRSRVDRAHRDAFAQTGLMHLLAVSGLHVLLVGMVLYLLLRPLLMRFRLRWQTVELLRAGCTVGVLVLYMLLTGSPPSVVRAVVMATLLIGGIVLQRSSHTLNTLGVAAVLLLLLRPTALYDAGFQLSFSAVAGIVALNPRLEEAAAAVLPESVIVHPAGRWLLSMITVSTAATLGTGPVLLHHFGFVALGGLVLNILAIPLTAVGLTAGLLTVLTGGLSAMAGSAFGASADLAIRLLVDVAALGATYFHAGARVVNPNGWMLATMTCMLVVLAQWPRPSYRWRLLTLAGTLAALGMIASVLSGTSKPGLELLFFDVGQGDAVLVTTPTGRHMLVDAGPRSPYSDAGVSVIIPHLRSRGVERLDAVVVTHPDSDHLGGVPSVLEAVEVGRFFHSGQVADTELYTDSRRLLKHLNVPERAVRAGDSISLDPHVAVEVLGPPPGFQQAGFDGENDASVVLAITYGKTQILLTGDVEQAGERWLVNTYGTSLATDVVKVPHHGSATSSTQAFVDAATKSGTAANTAIVPVGRGNRFGMPVPMVLTRWHQSNARVRRTDRGGAVHVWSDGASVDVRSMRSP